MPTAQACTLKNASSWGELGPCGAPRPPMSQGGIWTPAQGHRDRDPCGLIAEQDCTAAINLRALEPSSPRLLSVAQVSSAAQCLLSLLSAGGRALPDRLVGVLSGPGHGQAQLREATRWGSGSSSPARADPRVLELKGRPSLGFPRGRVSRACPDAPRCSKASRWAASQRLHCEGADAAAQATDSIGARPASPPQVSVYIYIYIYIYI